METRASIRGAKISAQKGRLVADLVRGKPIDKALNILRFSPKKAAGFRFRLQSKPASAEAKRSRWASYSPGILF